MGRAPTPYEWMVAQLHPEFGFGDEAGDVFRKLAEALWTQCDPEDIGKQLSIQQAALQPFRCFVDEAQVLLDKCPNMFLSLSGGTKNQRARPMYSAVLRSLCDLSLSGGTNNGILFSIFHGPRHVL